MKLARLTARAVGVALTILLMAVPSYADPGLEVEVLGVPRVGQPVTVRILLRDNCCPEPPCGWNYASGYGDVSWGDGTLDVWFEWTSGKPQPKPKHEMPRIVDVIREASHVFRWPGRYNLRVGYGYTFIANDSCDSFHRSLLTIATIDVEPDELQLVDGWLGLAFDQDATVCNQPVQPGTRFYVVAGLAGASSTGIAGAEFRLRPFPAGSYLFSASALPGWIAIGDAFGSGTTMAASCELSAGRSRVALLEITAFPMTATSRANLFVDAHTSPPNPTNPSPAMVLCDDPVFSARPAGLGYTLLLSPDNPMGSCLPIGPVSIQGRTWTQIKNLYR